MQPLERLLLDHVELRYNFPPDFLLNMEIEGNQHQRPLLPKVKMIDYKGRITDESFPFADS